MRFSGHWGRCDLEDSCRHCCGVMTQEQATADGLDMSLMCMLLFLGQCMCSGCCPVNGVCAPECHFVVSDSALCGCAAVQVSPAPATPDPQAVAAAADAVAGAGGVVAAAAGRAILQLHTCIVHAQLSTCMAQLSCVLCVSCQAVSTVNPPPPVCVCVASALRRKSAHCISHIPQSK